MLSLELQTIRATRELTNHFEQEPVRTKHPQLLYETKLYRILQGGGRYLSPIFVWPATLNLLPKKEAFFERSATF